MGSAFGTTVVIGAIVSFLSTSALAQGRFDKVEIKTTKIVDGIYMLKGAGGNIGLSVGDDGAFIIDDQFAPLSDKILAAVDAVSENSVSFVVNTHWHGDHTGGNEALSATGAHIVAHENVRERLKAGLKSETRNTPPAPAGALPVITFSHVVNFHWNNRDIHVVHPAPAHTDGDAFVFFRNANVLHMGDVFFNGGYPFIDLASGGDLDGYIAAQESALALINAETKIIPGHGALATHEDLKASIAMLKEVKSIIQDLIDSGKSEDDIVATDPLKSLNKKWGKGFINGERMTRTAVKSLSK